MRRRVGLGLLGALLLTVPTGTPAQIHEDMVLLTSWDTAPGARLTVDLGVAGLWQRGHFSHVALALHRQLRYGVSGAYRILANVVSLGERAGGGPTQ